MSSMDSPEGTTAERARCGLATNGLDSRAGPRRVRPGNHSILFPTLETPMLTDDLHSDAAALLPGRTTPAGATRRTALHAALGLGYAAAAAPIMAQTAIATSSD